jgi:hypothetical protein
MCTTALGPDRPSTDIEIRLDADALAPGKARRFVRHQVERLGWPRCVDDAALVVSELVTNAVAAAPSGPIFVALPPSSGRPVIEVWECATRRSVISPTQSGGNRREVPGSNGLPGSETVKGTVACQ